MAKTVQFFAHYDICDDSVVVAVRSTSSQGVETARIRVNMGSAEGGVGKFLNIVSQLNGLPLIEQTAAEKWGKPPE